MTGEQARAGEMDAKLDTTTDRIEEILDDFASDLGVRVPDSDWGDDFMASTVRKIAETFRAERDQSNADLAAARQENERLREAMELSREFADAQTQRGNRFLAERDEARRENAALKARIEAVCDKAENSPFRGRLFGGGPMPAIVRTEDIRAALGGEP